VGLQGWRAKGKGWGTENGLMGMVSIGEDENVLEIDSGDVCITMCICFRSGHLNIAKIINFMLLVFYYNLKM
jgi:hypothetical protein